jgi:hypothetical protein
MRYDKQVQAKSNLYKTLSKNQFEQYGFSESNSEALDADGNLINVEVAISKISYG